MMSAGLAQVMVGMAFATSWVSLTVATNWAIDPESAPQLYQSIGTIELIFDRLIAPAIANTVKAVTAHFDAEELITKRDQVAEQTLANETEEHARQRLAEVSAQIKKDEAEDEALTARWRKERDYWLGVQSTRDRLDALGLGADVVCVTSPGLLFRALRGRQGLGADPDWILDQAFPADRATPLVTVLATSRVPLDIGAERLYRLTSLDLSSAIQLFGDRAGAVDRKFRIEADAECVERICRRLDGIALAIELAAARVRTMSLENLAAHLQLRLLAGGRDRRPRQQTMRALIDWSFDLLTEEERRILRHCGVFQRGFTLQTAAVVCGEPDSLLLELFGSLVDKSLVVADALKGDQRYRLLEPIREYAWEKLAEAGELPEALRQHSVAFAAFARESYDEWDRGPEIDWLSRQELEVSNLRAAIRWSLDESKNRDVAAPLVADAAVIFLRLGLLDEGIDHCVQILQAEPALQRVHPVEDAGQVQLKIEDALEVGHRLARQQSRVRPRINEPAMA